METEDNNKQSGDQGSQNKDIGSFIGLVAFFIIGLLIIGIMLWPVISATGQG